MSLSEIAFVVLVATAFVAAVVIFGSLDALSNLISLKDHPRPPRRQIRDALLILTLCSIVGTIAWKLI